MSREASKGMSDIEAWEYMHLSYKMFQGYLSVFAFEMLLEDLNGINFIRCMYKQCNSASEPAICCL